MGETLLLQDELQENISIFTRLYYHWFSDELQENIPAFTREYLFRFQDEIQRSNIEEIIDLPDAPLYLIARTLPQKNVIFWDYIHWNIKKLELEKKQNEIWTKIYEGLDKTYLDDRQTGIEYRLRCVDNEGRTSSWVYGKAIMQGGGSWIF